MENIKSIIKEFFIEKTQILAVDLFGSFAKGTQNSFSDIDIAILCDPQNLPSKLDILQWREDLNGLLKKEIDLICLNDSSPIIGMQVEQNKIPIIRKDENGYAHYIMKLYSEYAELKELRKPMESNILKRKYYNE